MTDSNIEYYPDPIAAFNDGCLMDLKFRVAVEFIKSGSFGGVVGSREDSENLARAALDLSEALFEQGKKRGWIAPLPEVSTLNGPTKRHVERSIEAQLHGQKYAQNAKKIADSLSDVSWGLS